MRTTPVVLGLMLGLVGAPIDVAAHQPTLGDDHYPRTTYAESFDWHPTLVPPAWLKTQFEPAAETMWATGNATRAPRFTLDTTFNDNYVEYVSRANSSCDSLVMWDACTSYDGNLRWGRIVYNATASQTNWCEAPATDANGCLHVSRVALHEGGRCRVAGSGPMPPSTTRPIRCASGTRSASAGPGSSSTTRTWD